MADVFAFGFFENIIFVLPFWLCCSAGFAIKSLFLRRSPCGIIKKLFNKCGIAVPTFGRQAYLWEVNWVVRLRESLSDSNELWHNVVRHFVNLFFERLLK